MRNLRGKTVAITGAASGIGRALARELVEEGANVALSDVDEAGLQQTAAMLPGSCRVTTHIVDVAQRQAVEDYADQVRAQHGGADMIINNAGLTVRGTFEELDYADIELVVGVVFWGVLYGVKAFLPLLRERPEGHIVNIASINAEVPFHGNGPYNASKQAVAGLSETLVQELAGSPIGVTCVYPGGVRTSIARNAKYATERTAREFDRAARTSPESAARQILAGVRRGEERLFVGADAHALCVAKKLMPRNMVKWAGALSR